MRPLLALPAILVLAAALAGCSTSHPSGAAANVCVDETRGAGVPANHTVVALATSKGCIVAELYDNKAPVTVSNFLNYTRDGFYTDLVFHRVILGFMSQTGGFQTGGAYKTATHPAIKDEAVASGLKNLRYTLSMARTGPPDPKAPHTATSQFFINAADNSNLDPKGTDPNNANTAGYAVFGIVLSGRDVVDAINAVPVHACPDSGEDSCPDDPPLLLAVRVLA